MYKSGDYLTEREKQTNTLLLSACLIGNDGLFQWGLKDFFCLANPSQLYAGCVCVLLVNRHAWRKKITQNINVLG